jgi:ATP-dependent helicase IRC3
LVLPTGAGKTFTAVHFLHLRVLNEGYKVLWLAHTHHLLEQAFYGFSSDLSSIPEPKKHLRVRVVSGTPGHCEPRDIKPDDDVVIGTLQTIAQAYNKAQPQFLKYLEAAKDKLFVVFDEAHHSPAPSYRKLITAFRERVPSMYLLGMTATPTQPPKKPVCE